MDRTVDGIEVAAAAGGRSPRVPDARPISADVAVTLLRVVAGLMLMQHGVQKLFGWLLPSGQPFAGAPEMYSRMWVAGTLETFGGLLLAVGLLTRPVAFVLSGLMAFAYFLAHAGQEFWPILNGGELAALYCFVFLALCAMGGGRFSVDAVIERAGSAAPGESPRGRLPVAEYPNDRRRQKRRRRLPA